MSLWIAFFRGINVGGKNILPMRELKIVLADLGCEGISSYIQSGNVIFRHEETDAGALGAGIAAIVMEQFGFEPQVLVLNKRQLLAASENNPFPEAASEPKSLHLYFLGGNPVAADVDRLAALAGETERFKLIDRVFYLHAPDGIGRSKLAAGVEKALGIPATARNWRTVDKVLQLASSAT
jgi:uncharacterized protein (DUF1697 family)